MQPPHHVNHVPSSTRIAQVPRIVRMPEDNDVPSQKARGVPRRPATARDSKRAYRSAVDASSNSPSRCTKVHATGAPAVSSTAPPMVEPHVAVVREATKEIAMPDIASWPVQGSSSRLLDVLTRQAQSMDRERNPLLRADLLVESFKLLGNEMKSFRALFHVYVTELQLITRRLSDAQDATAQAEQRAADVESLWERKLHEQHVRMSHEIRALTQELEDNRAMVKKVEEDSARLRNMHADVERDKRLLQTRELEMVQSRKVQEQMAIQFAQRNQTLQDSIPPLEEEARTQRQHAETLRHANNSIAHRAAMQEKAASRTVFQLEDKIARQQGEIEEAANHNRRLAASLQVLRTVRDQAVSELAKATEMWTSERNAHMEQMRSMTPRPQYDASTADLGIQAMPRTAERFGALATRHKTLLAEMGVLERAHGIASQAMYWSQRGDTVGNLPSLLQMGSVEVSLVAFDANGVGSDDDEATAARSVPALYAWPQGVTRVLCKAMTLHDVVMRARELLDHCCNLQSRTSKHVELHVSMLAFFLEGVALGDYTVAYGQYPPTTSRIPMSVYEHCANMVRATDVWASEPIVRCFSVVLREDVGPWVWAHHKRLIVDVMSALVAEDQVSVAKAFGILHTQLEEWPRSVVLAAQRALLSYALPSSLLRGEHPVAAAPRKMSSSKGPSVPILENTQLRVMWDRDANLECSLVRRLRTILLEATLSVYAAFEAALLARLELPTAPPNYEQAVACTVDQPCVLGVLQSVCPGLDTKTANKFVIDVFELATNTIKAEASALKCNGFEYIGPQQGPASHQLFLPGRAEHYFGSFRTYPKLVTARVLSNRKQQNQRRRQSVAAQRKSVVSLLSPMPQVLLPPASRRGRDDDAVTPITSPSQLGMERQTAPRPSGATKPVVVPVVVLLRMVRKVPLPAGFATALDRPLECDAPDICLSNED